MSPVNSPSEILLVALFAGAARVEAAVESLWRRGLESERLSILAREPGAARDESASPVLDQRRQKAVPAQLWFRFPFTAVVHLPRLGLAVALGPLADELTRAPAVRRGHPHLEVALRRLGQPSSEAPRLERAVGEGRILLVACVSRSEVQDWGAILHLAGAGALTAHVRLDPWPREKRTSRARRMARRPSPKPTVSR